MRNRILLSMLGFGLSAFLMGSATMAWFTDSTSNTDNTFTSGTIDIEATRPSEWTGTYSNMAPGQTISTVLTVSNAGTLTMKYRMFSAYTGDAGLAAALVLTVKDSANSTLYAGPLSGFDLSQAFTRDGGNVVAAGGQDPLTLTVVLPTSATNAVAGKSVTVTFTLQATQPENTDWIE